MKEVATSSSCGSIYFMDIDYGTAVYGYVAFSILSATKELTVGEKRYMNRCRAICNKHKWKKIKLEKER